MTHITFIDEDGLPIEIGAEYYEEWEEEDSNNGDQTFAYLNTSMGDE